jgi:hypothetical protein
VATVPEALSGVEVCFRACWVLARATKEVGVSNYCMCLSEAKGNDPHCESRGCDIVSGKSGETDRPALGSRACILLVSLMKLSRVYLGA